MPQKVELRLVFSRSIKEIPDFGEGFSQTIKSLCLNVERLPLKTRGKKKIAPGPPRIGIVHFGGNLDEADFVGTDADKQARKCDFLVLWIERGALMPPNKSGERGYFVEKFWDVKEFKELFEGIKLFIQGVEVTLMRRVILIGTEVNDAPQWLRVPKDRAAPKVTKEDIAQALGLDPAMLQSPVDLLTEKLRED